MPTAGFIVHMALASTAVIMCLGVRSYALDKKYWKGIKRRRDVKDNEFMERGRVFVLDNGERNMVVVIGLKGIMYRRLDFVILWSSISLVYLWAYCVSILWFFWMSPGLGGFCLEVGTSSLYWLRFERDVKILEMLAMTELVNVFQMQLGY